ncbi:unnamed protein product, partial [Polarella glacialis]
AELSRLQRFYGLPLMILVEALSMVPTILFLVWLWEALAHRLVSKHTSDITEAEVRRDGWGALSGSYQGYNLEEAQQVLYPFCASLPWVMHFVHGSANFFAVVLLKWLVVGRFREGRPQSAWERFQRWLVERLWVNTEILSCCYRLLGVEYDLVGATVYKAVASDVRVKLYLGRNCSQHHVEKGRVRSGYFLRSLRLCDPRGRAAWILHGCPRGAEVGGDDGEELGNVFQGERIEGERVVTRQETGLEAAAPPPPLAPVAVLQRQLEAKALHRHTSCFWFTLFNVWCVLSSVVFAPLSDLLYWLTILIDFQIYDYFKDSGRGEIVAVLMIAPMYIVVSLTMLAMMCILKWILIGRWTAGDRPYYTWFHFRWASLMLAFSSLDDLQEAIAGTWLSVVFLRCMGAKVGKEVCFFGHGFEYDLLHIGDNVCIGASCDVTSHTVENMVMKMEEVRFERGASCLNGSVVMPGGVMEPGSTLIDHSQVLKGDSVPEGCYFGGLPGRLLDGYSSLLEKPANVQDAIEDFASGQPLLGGRSSPRQFWRSSPTPAGEVEMPGLFNRSSGGYPAPDLEQDGYAAVFSESESESPPDRGSWMSWAFPTQPRRPSGAGPGRNRR